MEVHPGQDVRSQLPGAKYQQYEKTVGPGGAERFAGPAAAHFNKTECFCFTQQELEGRRNTRYAAAFMVDPESPEEIDADHLVLYVF